MGFSVEQLLSKQTLHSGASSGALRDFRLEYAFEVRFSAVVRFRKLVDPCRLRFPDFRIPDSRSFRNVVLPLFVTANFAASVRMFRDSGSVVE